jgi:hypothetical protein
MKAHNKFGHKKWKSNKVQQRSVSMLHLSPQNHTPTLTRLLTDWWRQEVGKPAEMLSAGRANKMI